MKQPIISLMENLLQLENNSVSLYKKIATIDGSDNLSIRNIANVLAREEMRHADLYLQMIQEQKKRTLVTVDNHLIENAKDALKGFEQNLSHESFMTTSELLKFALECEIKTSTMLKEVLELLIKQDEEYTKELIIIFEKLIREEQKHAHNIKTVLK